MHVSTEAKRTHSYARIMFVAGAPRTTTSFFDGSEDLQKFIVRWNCGCQSTGPFQSMVWEPCQSHDHYTSVLNEEKTMSLLLSWGFEGA
jgi:hypothetical protein